VEETQAKRKWGRPPTTGEYRNIREEIEKQNKAKEAELRLLQEEKIAKMSGTEVLGLNKTVDVEEVTAEAEQTPTADIINKIRELQAEVTRVSKTSSNLKRTSQNTLNISAGRTVGLIKALRTRTRQKSCEHQRTKGDPDSTKGAG